ncbi:MAG: Cna B-type domain-containing protein [Oscillospiraceae bacterium]|nr:Cna B-type domain-containing protein [Oscillospiraceae bacterium]
MRTKLGRHASLLLCSFGLLLWMIAGVMLPVFADTQLGSLTMHCKTPDDVILDGMEWSIYYVGDRNQDGELELQGQYASFPVSLEDESASALTDAARTLETYAMQFGLDPLATAVSDANGYLKFSQLEPGLYLVSGKGKKVEDRYYFPSAFLVEISASGDAQLDMSANPKFLSMNSNAGSWNYTVKKVWENDEDYPENRSAYITVEIYRDDVLFETVRLDESNDWTYEWSSTSFHQWRVWEKEVPEDYYVVYRSNETQFVIVNALTISSVSTETTPYTDDVNTETRPTDDTANSDSQTTPDTEDVNTETIPTTIQNDTNSITTAATSDTTTTTKTTNSETEKLPQTGQLWWPVPLLGLAGLISIAVGMRLRTKE